MCIILAMHVSSASEPLNCRTALPQYKCDCSLWFLGSLFTLSHVPGHHATTQSQCLCDCAVYGPWEASVLSDMCLLITLQPSHSVCVTVQFMVPGKPLYSLTCAWSSRYNPVTEVEGPGADGDTDVIHVLHVLAESCSGCCHDCSLSDAVHVTVTRHCYCLLLHVTITVAV